VKKLLFVLFFGGSFLDQWRRHMRRSRRMRRRRRVTFL
jgi:hypothetical protein